MKKHFDEMDKNIRLRAQALGFQVGILILAIWTAYESYVALSTGQRLNIVPCLILTALNGVCGFYESFLKQKMVKGDDEYKEPNKVFLTIIAVLVIAAIAVSIGTYIVIR